MKRAILYLIMLITLISCKSFLKNSNHGSFRIINTSNKIIEFVWLTPEGDFFPIAKSINITKNEIYEAQGLMNGYYDIAIDFKSEYNSFNSKKNKELCLYIEKGFTTVWTVNRYGEINRK